MQFDTLLPFVNGLTASVFVVDADRRVLLANDAARALFGAGLVGVDFVQAVRNPKCLEAIASVLGGEKRSEIVMTMQNPVRTTYKVSVSRLDFSQARPGENEPRAIISLEDVSHIYEAEQMRSEFVANVSHELRSPLTSLNGFIETLKGPAKDDPEARQRFLSIMENEAQRMNRLIGDLLSLSKVEADVHIRPDSTADLRALAEQVVTLLGPLAKREDVQLTLKIPDTMDTVIPGDSDQLQQVLINLTENGIKYGGKGGHVYVELSDRQLAVGARARSVQIDVTDAGPGFEAEHIPRLTERFYRVDKGRSREKGGTGLGLAIVKHIVARHRGRLRINSQVGQGSHFSVVLPR